jgi:hypothetical protein
MHRDYVEWIPPENHRDIAFITHEYSHRIIEQIAGLNSQINYKWFDEGLAQYEGQRALTKRSPNDAASQISRRTMLIVQAYTSGSLTPLKDITTEWQWEKQIKNGGQLAYPEAWAAIDYLISQGGIALVKDVLTLVGKGQSFAAAFQKVYGLTVDEFEKEFRVSVAKDRDALDATACFKMDGQADDWQNLKPLIAEEPNPTIAHAADVLKVYAITCQEELYVMLVVDGMASSGADISYCFDVDTNNDGIAEYQGGFDRTRAWLWNLKGAGYADKKNLSFPEGVRIAVGGIAECMFPLNLLDDVTSPSIRIYTFVAHQLGKQKTIWAQVPSLVK